MMDHSITLSANDKGRLDQRLAEYIPLSRRRIRQAIDDGSVYVNRKRCRKAGKMMRGGEGVRLLILEEEQLVPFKAEQLLWQSKGLILIHKRCGQYSQEALHRSKGTLPDEISRFLQLPTTSAVRPVHRLDRGTSGLMLLSSSPEQLQQLQTRWRAEVQKSYLGIIAATPEWSNQRISTAISPRRDPRGRYPISAHGRACDTEVIRLQQHAEHSLLQLIPHTGRSHQLRVHLASIGCPLLGDSRYGGKKAPRLMLHAHTLHFPLPDTTNIQHWTVEPEDDWLWPQQDLQGSNPVTAT